MVTMMMPFGLSENVAGVERNIQVVHLVVVGALLGCDPRVVSILHSGHLSGVVFVPRAHLIIVAAGLWPSSGGQPTFRSGCEDSNSPRRGALCRLTGVVGHGSGSK